MAEISSLIPKKTLGGGVSSIASSVGVGVFFRISFILFLASAMLTGGLYLFRNYTRNNLAEQKSLLQKISIEFEPTLIEELERVSKSIREAKEILRLHAHTSKIFDLLESNTLTNVSFSGFAFSIDKNTVAMPGEAPSYAAVAAQAAVFGALPEVTATTFSGLSLKDTGVVSFTINLELKE